MEPKRPETSVIDYHPTLRNTPEKCRSHIWRSIESVPHILYLGHRWYFVVDSCNGYLTCGKIRPPSFLRQKNGWVPQGVPKLKHGKTTKYLVWIQTQFCKIKISHHHHVVTTSSENGEGQLSRYDGQAAGRLTDGLQFYSHRQQDTPIFQKSLDRLW
jgi:hypothetical protein